MAKGPTIQFYGGIGTIGGTKIIVQEGDYRVLFDFGLSYAPGGDYWGAKIEPRIGSARLRDMIAMGYVPSTSGLYRAEDAATLGLAPGEGEQTQAFISHLHLDHMAVVDLLADEMPIWMHSETLRLFAAVATTGERPAVPKGARGFEWGQTINVGPMKVTPVAVDHDIPGATALLIETSSGTVVYTGDLRLHGLHPERIEQFIAQARATNPRILLIEGTRLGEPEPTADRAPTRPEGEVAAEVAAQARAAEGLALISLYPRNTARMINIAREIGSANRTLVLSPEAAHIYAALGGDLALIGVYQRAKDKLALEAGTAEPWLKDLFAKAKVLDATAIRADQRQYLLQLFYWDINELVDIAPQEGSIFIHSNGEPLGRYDPAFALFERWLAAFGVELTRAYSTGHAAPADLRYVVAGVAPQILMPIHSHKPELLEVEGIRRILPELGAHYDIATGERV